MTHHSDTPDVRPLDEDSIFEEEVLEPEEEGYEDDEKPDAEFEQGEFEQGDALANERDESSLENGSSDEEQPQARSLLEELDRQQDDVLQQLDDLNDKIEQLLEEHTGKRNAQGLDEDLNAAEQPAEHRDAA